MASLAVLIPSREEIFLNRTIEDILAHAHGDTSVVVVLDGQWPQIPIPDHPKVHLVYHPVSIGQRAATNEAARIASADFVMKLDAHCALDDGFDVKLLEPYETGELDRLTTSIPAQYNLHAYDRICKACGDRTYQGPMAAACQQCKHVAGYDMVVVWQPRKNRITTSWVLDKDLHFQYDKRDPKKLDGRLDDVMTSLGACFVMRRDRFFELGGLDESIGSWGQYGQEIACKSWLSGGRHIVNKRTWFAHFFRVGGIGFPYPISGSEQEKARKRARRLWMGNNWPGQVKPLSWLVRKFEPIVPRNGEPWEPQGPSPSVGVVYFTDNRLDSTIFSACQQKLASSLNGHALVSVSLEPLDFGRNVHVQAERGRLTMFRQILAGLEALDTDIVFLAEHDCLYPPEHFQFLPPRTDRIYYDQSVWRVDADTGRAVTYQMKSVSGCCAHRPLLLDYYRRLVAEVEAHGYDHKQGYEAGVREGIAVGWRSSVPYVDIRHGQNLTASRWSQDAFHDKTTCEGWQEADAIPGWGMTRGRFPAWLAEVAHG